MAMSQTLAHYLDSHNVNYELINHRHTDTAFNTAMALHVSSESMVKAVLLKDSEGYVVAAVPSEKGVSVPAINHKLGRELSLASEEEVGRVFSDCEPGAAPAIGQAFDLPIVWDEQLSFQPKVYVEAGDHTHVVELSHYEFMELMEDVDRGEISYFH